MLFKKMYLSIALCDSNAQKYMYDRTFEKLAKNGL